MKEKIRKLLTEHERLYWLIVIGASILALVLSTMLLSKTESAHAAETTDGAYYPDITEIDWGEHEETIKSIVEANSRIIVCKSGNIYKYLFVSEDAVQKIASGSSCYKVSIDGIADLTYSGRYENRFIEYNANTGEIDIDPTDSNYTVATLYGTNTGAAGIETIYAIGSNYDYRDADRWDYVDVLPYNNLTYPTFEDTSQTSTSITVCCSGKCYDIPLEGYKYYFVAYDTSGYAKIYITNTPLTGTENNGELTIAASGAGDVLMYGTNNKHLSYKKTRSLYADCTFNFAVSNFKYHESNYNFKDSETGEILYTANSSPNVAEVTYTYLVNAPYIVFDALKIDNPTINGQEVCTDMTQYDWKYRGHLSGQSLDATSYELQHKMYVRLPSKEYIDKFMDETLDVLIYAFIEDAYLEDIVELINDWNEDCKSNKSAYDTYAIEFVERYSDLEMSHLWNKNAPIISKDAEHIYSAICEQYESFWYDIWLKDIEKDRPSDDFDEKTRAMEKKIITAFVWSCMYVERVDSVLYTTTSDAIYYGRMVSNHFNFGVINYCVTVETLEDYMNDDSNEEQYQKQLEQAYKEALAKSEAEKDGLQSNIDNIYRGTNAYSDLSSSDIWDYAKSMASGLVGSLDWIKKLGAVVASVFSFIPGVNENIIVPVFVIGIITAIIAFIRGK